METELSFFVAYIFYGWAHASLEVEISNGAEIDRRGVPRSFWYDEYYMQIYNGSGVMPLYIEKSTRYVLYSSPAPSPCSGQCN
jgi:hypothetical protein